jgi:hypothetical protein
VANITTTNVDLGSVALEVWGTLDAVLRNAAGAEHTFVEGTLLARHATDGKLYPYDPADTTEDLDQPKYVLMYDVTAAATSDNRVTVLSAGRVNQQRLLIDDGSTVEAAAAADLDKLLNRPIIPVDTTQLAKIDNPQS